jgi:aspartyl-tRNA(Asn)/glutamyl-tRNA(Gln) amidotransferase subunit C
MLSKDQVEKVSALARLKLSDDEIAAFAEQLSAVLKNFEDIAQIDTRDLAPLFALTNLRPCLRPDEIRSPAASTDAGCLSNAPEKSGRLFKVPPVV